MYPCPPRIYFIPTDKVLITRVTFHVLCSDCIHISHQLFILRDAPNPSGHVYGRYVCTFNYKALNEISKSQNKISQLVYFTHNHLILFQTRCSYSTLKNGCGMLLQNAANHLLHCRVSFLRRPQCEFHLHENLKSMKQILFHKPV